MSQIVYGRLEGQVIRLEESIEFPPNARLRLTIEDASDLGPNDYIFLRTAREQNLEGPADGSERVDHYLYGEPGDGA